MSHLLLRSIVIGSASAGLSGTGMPDVLRCKMGVAVVRPDIPFAILRSDRLIVCSLRQPRNGRWGG